MDMTNTVGERLKLERLKQRMSLDEVGMMVGGLKKNTISQYETGKRNPPLDVLIELAYSFDVSLDYLAGLSDDPDPRIDQRDLKKIFQKSPLHYDGVVLTSHDLEPVRSVLQLAVRGARHRMKPIGERREELATSL